MHSGGNPAYCAAKFWIVGLTLRRRCSIMQESEYHGGQTRTGPFSLAAYENGAPSTQRVQGSTAGTGGETKRITGQLCRGRSRREHVQRYRSRSASSLTTPARATDPPAKALGLSPRPHAAPQRDRTPRHPGNPAGCADGFSDRSTAASPILVERMSPYKRSVQ